MFHWNKTANATTVKDVSSHQIIVIHGSISLSLLTNYNMPIAKRLQIRNFPKYDMAKRHHYKHVNQTYSTQCQAVPALQNSKNVREIWYPLRLWEGRTNTIAAYYPEKYYPMPARHRVEHVVEQSGQCARAHNLPTRDCTWNWRVGEQP